MMPRHRHVGDEDVVIDHDRGVPVSGKGRNSPIKPVLPPHAGDDDAGGAGGGPLREEL